MSNAQTFLQAELEHAERHLARIRRIQIQMQANLEAAGLDEVKVYEHLAANKAHRQLQRDEAFYQQMWLRIHRQLQRFENLQPAPAFSTVKPSAQKKPEPGRNAPCPCGSTFKYKRCCGNPLRTANAAAA